LTSCDFDEFDKAMLSLAAEGIGSATLGVAES